MGKCGVMWGKMFIFANEFNIISVHMRFLGKTEARIDVKGRLFLPANFRKEFQGSHAEKLVLRKDVFNDCIVIYPEAVWNKQMESLRKRLNRWNKTHQQVFRQFISEAESVQLDASGRLLLPRRCIEAAGIELDVEFIGMGDTIEIWAKQNTTEPFMEAASFGKAIESLMGDDISDFALGDQKQPEEEIGK